MVLYFGNSYPIVLSDETTYHNRGTATSGEDNNKTISSGKKLSVYPEFP
jgi:hypothetical protein